MSRTTTKGIDYTSKDYESFRSDMIKQLGIKMPEYTDIRQSDAGIVILELLAQGLDILSYYQDAMANEAYLVTEELRSNALKWCYLLGYVPRASTPTEFTQVFVLSSAQLKDTVIPKGTVVKTKGSIAEPSIYFETKEDLIIPAGKLGDEMSDNEYLYKTKVVQGISVSNEIVGSSTEVADQSFTLKYSPVILDSIVLYVNEGSGPVKWERVDNFVDSNATSQVYTVSINDNDEAIITFGDGVFGKIPSYYKNGIFCNYRVGGGEQGNVGANMINLLDSNIALVDRTFNPYTCDVRGENKETLEEIKRNAPNSNRTKWGALTTTDFADVIKLNFVEVDKVSAYNNPDNSRDIDIYLILKEDKELTEEVKSKINSLFDENEGGRKIVGAGNIALNPAIRVPLEIEATLSVKDRYNFEEVKSNIEEFIVDYFKVGNIDFDTEFIPANIVAEVMNPVNAIEGVRFFTIDKVNGSTSNSFRPNNGEIFTLANTNIVNGG